MHVMTNSMPPNTRSEKVVELRLPSRLGYERVAMDTASSLARRMGFQPDQVDALRTAVSEAVTNAIEHGNEQDESTKVVVVLSARESELVISVADQGKKRIAEPPKSHTPQIAEKIHATDKGGWGIWFMRSFMDEVEFSIAPTGGNQVRMVIRLEQQSA